jgi:Uma2 family endonuclease
MPPTILDSEKPYLEYHAGRAVRKVSPRTKHALVQGAMLVILRRSAGADYRVGTEWDCDLSQQLGNKTLLVPDVCAIAAERLASLPEAKRECPPFAPDVVVEVRSPNDRLPEREWKVRAYLQAGTLVVLDVIPDALAIDAITLSGRARFHEKDGLRHDAVRWLRFEVAEAFADLRL